MCRAGIKKVFASLALYGLIASAQPAKPASQPPDVVRDFYRWYLQAIAKSKDPATKDRAGLKNYVSADCIAMIDRKMKSPDGLDADYFLQAQDFEDNWISNISVKETARTATTATMAVVLGKSPSEQKLTVRLRNEKGVWKIVAVTP